MRRGKESKKDRREKIKQILLWERREERREREKEMTERKKGKEEKR